MFLLDTWWTTVFQQVPFSQSVQYYKLSVANKILAMMKNDSDFVLCSMLFV